MLKYNCKLKAKAKCEQKYEQRKPNMNHVEHKSYNPKGGERMEAQIIPLIRDELSSANLQLTGTHISILTSLYYQPRQQQKILASNVHIPVTSLSNMLSKILKMKPALISCSKLGRSHYYSLTDAGTHYVENLIRKNEVPDLANSILPRTRTLMSPVDDALSYLIQFKQLTGNFWENDLLEMLKNGNTINDPAYHALEKLLKSLKTLVQNEDDDGLARVYNVLGNNQVEIALQLHLSQSFGDYFIFRPLYRLQPSMYYKIVTDIFTEMTTGPVNKSSYITDLITVQDYYALYYHISCIMNKDFLSHSKREDLTVDYWTTKYSAQSAHLLYYIASKFTSLFHTQ